MTIRELLLCVGAPSSMNIKKVILDMDVAVQVDPPWCLPTVVKAMNINSNTLVLYTSKNDEANNIPARQ